VLIALLYTLIVLCSIFLICLVLIQRGRGGGLAGAFGGAGGSSAFGTRAGDVFTRITIVTAAIWIGLNMLLVILANQRRDDRSAFAPTPKQEIGAGILPGEVNQGTGGASKKASGGTDSLPSPLESVPGIPSSAPTAPSPLPKAPARTP
jgi:preprotein translocase subunit SecG